jgi:hypothetical protein
MAGGSPNPPARDDTSREMSAKAKAFGERKKLARETKTSVVKCALRSRLHEGVREKLAPVIESAVEYATIACFRGSRILNSIVVKYLSEDILLPDITRDAFIDAVIHGNEAYEDIASALSLGMNAIPAPVRPKGYGSPVAQLARNTYKTALMNSMFSAFDSRLKRGVQAWASQLPGRKPSESTIKAMANCISGRKPVGANRLHLLHPREVAFIRQERSVLGLGSEFIGLEESRPFGEPCATDAWLKQNWRTVLAAYHRWLREVERSPTSIQRWSLVPLCGLNPVTVQIDTKVLFHLMRGAGIVLDKWDAFKEMASEQFASVFKIGNVVRSQRYVFANHVATNGTSLCVHYRIPKEAREKKKRMRKVKQDGDRGPFEGFDKRVDENGATYRVIGNDPGRSNVSFMAEVTPDGCVRAFSLTRQAYYAMSGTKSNAALCHKNLRRFKEAWSNRTSAKTSFLSDILVNARQVGSTLEEEWDVRSRKCLRRAAFAAWSGRNRVLDSYFRRIRRAGGKSPVCIAAGNAVFASSATGAPSAPTRQIEKKMIAYFGARNVKPVDEFRTTMMDNASRERLHSVVRIKEVVEDGKAVNRAREIRGLKLSRSSETNLMLTGFPTRLVNCDLNAALNIRLVGISGPRPQYLERGVALAHNKSLVLHRRSHSRPTKTNISAVRMRCA